jgi:hypothetical protein
LVADHALQNQRFGIVGHEAQHTVGVDGGSGEIATLVSTEWSVTMLGEDQVAADLERMRIP